MKSILQIRHEQILLPLTEYSEDPGVVGWDPTTECGDIIFAPYLELTTSYGYSVGLSHLYVLRHHNG